MHENEIVKVPYLWQRSPDEQPWLLTFYLGAVDERLECVGMEIRSYVRRIDDDLSPNERWEPRASQLRQSSPDEFEAMCDDDPVASVTQFDRVADHLHPLRALTLRQLPFADVLARARRTEATAWAGGAEVTRDLIEKIVSGEETFGAENLDKFEAHVRAADEFARLIAPPLLKSGRHAKYTMEHLELVAKLYTEAYTTHASSSPTKDVAEKLHLSRNQVAKLVMRCRDPQVGLLEPTEKRKAGGAKRSPRGKQGS